MPVPGPNIFHVRALAADARFKPHFSQLADFRDAKDVDVSLAGIIKLAELNPFRSGARRAVVIHDDVIFGMARMYRILREPAAEEFELFRNMDLALDWLGIAQARAEILVTLSQIVAISGLD
ncbi:MAG: hypothetical protein LAO31_21325 [Acidobacteriia bacterium]|nr:hypothetical protein [Terriglobia bacterium]